MVAVVTPASINAVGRVYNTDDPVRAVPIVAAVRSVVVTAADFDEAVTVPVMVVAAVVRADVRVGYVDVLVHDRPGSIVILVPGAVAPDDAG